MLALLEPPSAYRGVRLASGAAMGQKARAEGVTLKELMEMVHLTLIREDGRREERPPPLMLADAVVAGRRKA